MAWRHSWTCTWPVSEEIWGGLRNSLICSWLASMGCHGADLQLVPGGTQMLCWGNQAAHTCGLWHRRRWLVSQLNCNTLADVRRPDLTAKMRKVFSITWIFLVDFYFLSGLKFTAKLNANYRVPIYSLDLHRHNLPDYQLYPSPEKRTCYKW